MNQWPEWTLDLVWTITAIGVVYLVGYTLRVVIGSRLARLAARTEARWDDVLIGEVKRRIPLWSVLIGSYLSLPRWELPTARHELVLHVIQAIGVASVTLGTATVLARMVVDYGARSSTPVSALTQNFVRIIVTLLGTLMVLQVFGWSIAPWLTVLGVGGLAVALALQDPLSNFFAGLSVSLAGQIRIGDYVRLDAGGAEGYVVDFNWRSTRLRQLGDNIIDVPNSKLAQAIVTNFSQPGNDIPVGVEFTVEACNDLAEVERIALSVAQSTVRDVTGAVPTAPPAVRFGAFVENGVKVTVGVRTRGFAEQFVVRHEIIKRLHQQFAAAGITFADMRGAAPRPGLAR